MGSIQKMVSETENYHKELQDSPGGVLYPGADETIHIVKKRSRELNNSFSVGIYELPPFSIIRKYVELNFQ